MSLGDVWAEQVDRRWAAIVEDRPRWQQDLLLLTVALGAVYLLYVFFGLATGLDVNGIVSTLRRVTFFAAAFALLALALNLHWGYTGLFNIGVAGFMSIAVFTMAVLSGGDDVALGLPIWVGVLAGIAVAALAGFLVALPALRLRADYFAIVTLGVAEIVRLGLQSGTLREFTVFGIETGTRGSAGITPEGIDNYVYYLLYEGGDRRGDPHLLGENVFVAMEMVGVRESVVTAWTYALVLVVVVVLVYLLLNRVVRSPYGRLLKAIREDELAAQSLGKDTTRVKIASFMLGCALMGLAGILWQGSRGTVTPDAFMPIVTFYVFVALIIGGSGSNAGSILGGLLFTGLLYEGPEFVDRLMDQLLDTPRTQTFYDGVAGFASLDPMPFLGYLQENMDQVQFVILGVVLIALMLSRPDGVLGHRKEVAAATDLSDRGGEGDE